MNTFEPHQNINVSRLPKDGEKLTLLADGQILDFLTDETPATEVFSFEATVAANRWKHNGAVLEGTISAKIAQECIASLEPIETELNFRFERFFLPPGDPELDRELIMEGELIIDPDEDDLPDVLDGNTIDVWEVLLEELNLQIDPFPRKADVEWHGDDSAEVSDEPETAKPFADLKTLINKKNPQ